MITTQVGGYSPHDAADLALCKWVYERLTQDYPGHDWLVGANAEAGTVVVDLPYVKPYKYRNHAYLLHIRALDGHDTAVRKLRHAGGEILERFNLPRGPATEETRLRAIQNGLDVS